MCNAVLTKVLESDLVIKDKGTEVVSFLGVEERHYLRPHVLSGVNNPVPMTSPISELQRLQREQRDDVIRKMKDMMQGVTIRQLARITGISKCVIDRI